MKIAEANNQEIIIGASKSQMFGIDTSTPIIFDILRNKMYSNKIGAVAREVASNSRDANRESGTDRAMQIEFTHNIAYLTGDISLIFRDFGLGISPDRMANVFLNYGSSTKRESDEQTGGYGLGAKTPFAYTDSFIIHTVNDNVEYFYNAIIDKTGNGKMILISEEFTDKPSGTEIIVPILSTSDRNTFEKEIYKATSYWEGIEYINFTTQKPVVDYLFQNDNFKIAKSNGWADVVGLIDGIPYEIRPTDRTTISGYTIMFDLELSGITINANRESLQYDDKTQAYIDAKYAAFKEGVKELVDEFLGDSKTYREAFIKQKALKNSTYKNDVHSLVYAMKQRSLFGWDYYVTFKGEPVKAIKFKYHTVDSAKWDSWSEKMKYSPSNVDLELPVVYLDEGRVSLVKNKELKNFLFIKPIKGNPEDCIKEEFDKLMEITEGDYQKYSEVKLPPGVSATPVKRDYVTFKVREQDTTYRSMELYFDKVSKKLKNNTDKHIIFMPVDSLRGRLYSTQDRVIILKELFKVDYIYFINESSYRTHLKPAGYKTFDELWSTIDLTQFSKYLDIVKIKNTIEQFPKIIVNNFSELLPKSYDYLVSQDVEIPQSFRHINWSNLGVKQGQFDYDGVYEKFKKTIKLNYPLLSTYLSYSRDSEELKIKNISNYIKK